MTRRALIVFGRYPVAGQVKSRLAASIGDELAAELYESFLADTVELAVNCDADVRLHLAGSRPEGFSMDFGPGVQVLGQSGEGLGERMSTAFGDAFSLGFEPVCIIGTDHPNLPEQYVHRAFRLLETSDSVIGPTEDGGYYLLGLREPNSDVFDGMTYSHPDVFAQARERLEDLGLSCQVIETWYDVDTIEDLRRLRGDLLGGTKACRNTKRTLAAREQEIH